MPLTSAAAAFLVTLGSILTGVSGLLIVTEPSSLGLDGDTMQILGFPGFRGVPGLGGWTMVGSWHGRAGSTLADARCLGGAALATALPKANLVPTAGIGSAGRPRSRTSSMYTSARLTARAAEPPLAASPAQSSRRARLCRALTVYVLPLPVWP